MFTQPKNYFRTKFGVITTYGRGSTVCMLTYTVFIFRIIKVSRCVSHRFTTVMLTLPGLSIICRVGDGVPDLCPAVMCEWSLPYPDRSMWN